MIFGSCPGGLDELAEKYCLGRLDSSVAEAFEDHYLGCPPCAWRASLTHDFIEAVRQVKRLPLSRAKKSSRKRNFR